MAASRGGRGQMSSKLPVPGYDKTTIPIYVYSTATNHMESKKGIGFDLNMSVVRLFNNYSVGQNKGSPN